MMETQYENSIKRWSDYFDVPEPLVREVIKNESNNDPDAVSPKGAIGLMQVMPYHGRNFDVDLKDPDQNIYAGVRILKENLDRRGGDPVLALVDYNAGPNRTDRWLNAGKPLPRETVDYIGRFQGLPSRDIQERSIVDLTGMKKGGPFDPDTSPEPPTKRMIPWQSIEAHPDFQTLDPDKQFNVRKRWFDENIANSEPFKAISPEQQSIFKTNFFAGVRIPRKSQEALEAPTVSPEDVAAFALTGGASGLGQVGARGVTAAGKTLMEGGVKGFAKGAAGGGLGIAIGEQGATAGAQLGEQIGGEPGRVIGEVLGGTMPLVGLAKWFEIFGRNPLDIKPKNAEKEFQDEIKKVRGLLETPEEQFRAERGIGAEEPSARPEGSGVAREPTWEELTQPFRTAGKSDFDATADFFKANGGMANAARRYASVRDYLRGEQIRTARANQEAENARYRSSRTNDESVYEEEMARRQADFEERLRQHEEDLRAWGNRPKEAPVAPPGPPAVVEPQVMPEVAQSTEGVMRGVTATSGGRPIRIPPEEVPFQPPANIEKPVPTSIGTSPNKEPIVVEPKAPGKKTIRTKISPTEAKKLTPKEQKQYLLTEIDAAIKRLGKEPAGPGRNVEFEVYGTRRGKSWYANKELVEIENAIDIEVPGDGIFTVRNSTGSLEAFKKTVSSNFPSKELKPLIPKGVKPEKAKKALGRRIAEEDVIYYNEFSPRPASAKDMEPFGDEKSLYVTKDGFLSNGYMFVKANIPASAIKTRDVAKQLLPDDAKPVDFTAEFYRGFSPKIEKPSVHFMSGKKEAIANAKYVDIVLGEHPTAKAFITDQHHAIEFRVGKTTVGAIMPMVGDKKASIIFADRIAELTGKSPLDVLKSESGAINLPALKDVTDSFREFWGPLSTLPQSAKYMEGRYKAFGDIARVDSFVNKIYDRLKAFPEGTRTDIFKYLDGQIQLTTLPPEARTIANQLRRLNNQIGAMLVKRGLLKQETLDKHFNQYIHYMYLKHELSPGTRIPTNRGRIDWGILKARKGLTPEEQKSIGLIEDAAIAEPIGVSKALSDVAKFDRFQLIANNPDWAFQPNRVRFEGKLQPVGDLVEEREMQARVVQAIPNVPEAQERLDRIDRAIAMTRNPTDMTAWKRLVGREWGPLNGVYVRKQIYRDLVPFMAGFKGNDIASRALNLVQSAVEASTTLFKIGKVAINLPTVMRNIGSNQVQLMLSGINAKDLYLKWIPEAVKAWKNNDPIVRLATRNGIFNTNWSQAEIQEVYDAIKAMSGEKSWYSQSVKLAQGVSKYYGKIDDFFKLVKFMERRGAGKTPGEAAREAQKWGMDYSLAHPVVKFVRRFPMPFISYQYKIIPLLAESAKKYPWVIAGLASLPWILNEWTRRRNDMSEEDFDKLKKDLPSYVRKSKSLILLPWKSPEGNWQWVDYSFWLPWGNLLQLEASMSEGDVAGIARNMGLGNPIYSVLHAIVSARGDRPPQDAFRGVDIYNPLDPPQIKAAKMAEWVYGLYGPSMLTSYGALGKTIKAYLGDKDKYGRTVSPGQAGASWIGWNVIAPTKEQREIEMRAKIKQLKSDYFKAIASDPNLSESRRYDIEKRFFRKALDITEGKD